MNMRRYTRHIIYSVWVILAVGAGLVVYFSLDTLNYEGQPTAYIIPVELQEIKGDTTLGQTFVAPYDNLYRLDVIFLTYGRKNTADVTLHLREARDGVQDLVSVTFNAADVRDKAWHTFTFPPIPDSAGKTYLFYFHSPDSTPGNAITLGGSEGDFYPYGNAFLGPAPINADVAFRTHYEMPLSRKLATFAERLTRGKPGILGQAWFYVLLVVVYVALAVLFFWRAGVFALEDGAGEGSEVGGSDENDE